MSWLDELARSASSRAGPPQRLDSQLGAAGSPPSPPPELRDYQRECREAIEKAYAAGINRQLVSLPTGCGKTVCFAQLPHRFNQKMLVLAHREELLEQAREQLLAANPHLWVEIEQAERRASPMADAVVASVPTLGRRGSPRLARFAAEEWPLIVCDEAHHSVASSYLNIFNHFQVFDHPARLLVGWTATPRRGDRVGLEAVYQDIVFHRDLREMIEAGWLCPITAYRVRTGADLAGVGLSHGDFIEAELSQAVDTPERNRLVADAYAACCADRRTLVFCVDRAHTHHLAETFQARGIPCAVVLGDTPAEERAGVLAALASGEVRVVANCMVLTEGYDLPQLEAVIMARPTASSLLYTQMVGPGLRTAPGKAEVVVVDLADNCHRHRLVSLPSLFGLPADFDLEGGSVTRVVREIEELAQLKPEAPMGQGCSLDEVRRIVESFDIFAAASQLDEMVEAFSELTWVAVDDGYCLTLLDQARLVIAPNLVGKYEVCLYRQGQGNARVAVRDDLRQAFQVGDAFMRRAMPEQVGLFWRGARWRREPASDRQKFRLREWGIPFPETLTKGQAALIISRRIAQQGK